MPDPQQVFSVSTQQMDDVPSRPRAQDNTEVSQLPGRFGKGPEPTLVTPPGSNTPFNSGLVSSENGIPPADTDSFMGNFGDLDVGNHLTVATNAGSAARVASAAATSAAAAVGEAGATSPNFTRIYGFFAALFDPTQPSGVSDLIEGSDLSALDLEIIKLLVRNLEVNVDNVGFRQQLTETYRQQQMRLQGQQQG